MEVGRPVTATLWGLSRGPVMLYHGQEVGEPALGRSVAQSLEQPDLRPR